MSEDNILQVWQMVHFTFTLAYHYIHYLAVHKSHIIYLCVLLCFRLRTYTMRKTLTLKLISWKLPPPRENPPVSMGTRSHPPQTFLLDA